jgi:ferredoxin--NADP+ reductase
MQTVATLVEDFNNGLLDDPRQPPSALETLIRARQPDLVDAAGWRAIDVAEISRGEAAGRPRVKFTSVSDMLSAARNRPGARLAEVRARLTELVSGRNRRR